MHIATVGPTFPARGGIARFTTLLVRRLREQHQVDLYSFSRLYPRLLFPGSTRPDPSAQPVREPAYDDLDGLNPLSWRRTGKLIAASRPDLLLLQWWTPYWLLLFRSLTARARASGVPVLTLVHQLVEPDASFVEFFVNRSALRRSDGLLLLSEEDVGMARRVLPSTPARLVTLPGLHPDQQADRQAARRRLGVDFDQPLVLFFGFVRRYKGLPYLLDALARLADVHLIVAGQFWQNEGPYREQINKLGLEDRVTILNHYHCDEEVADLFAAADALVLPYLSGNQSAVAASAMDHGLPVIATTVGGLAETVSHSETGLLVPPRDSQGLAEAIHSFFSDNLGPAFRRAIKAAGGRTAWVQLVGQIEDLGAEVRLRQSSKDIHES